MTKTEALRQLGKAQHDMDRAHDWTAYHAAKARAEVASRVLRNV